MGKKSKGKHRLDKFYHLAKEQGYRSRAAFKLVQLNRKYDFLSSTRTLLDLCAAPGGWLQVAAKTMPVGSLIVGVDLDPIRAIPGVTTFVGDITSQKTRQDLKKTLGGAMADTVIHDGAPNVGGVWASEAYTQSALVLDALRLATEFLGPRGTFVTKIFRSQDYNSLLYAFKQLFEKVDATKPAASRNTSAEIFVVCQEYRAPTKIDPRLLDSKHLFREVEEAPKKMGPDALLKDKFKANRQRQGYEDGISTTSRTAPATAFVLSEAPVEMLGRFTSFALEGPDAEAAPEAVEGDGDVVGALGYAALAAHIRDSPATTAEIRATCADLQVLGRSEFKALLKWRMQIKRELKAPAEKPAEPAKAAEPVDSEEEAETREAAVLEEMQAVKESADKRAKKERKKKREARIKARIRAAQMAKGEGVNQDEGVPGESLFSLTQLRGQAAATAAEQEAPAEAELDEMDRDEAAAQELVMPEAPGNSSDDSDDEGHTHYNAMTEDALEDAYSQYLQRQGQRDAAARRRARLQTKQKPGDVLGGGPDAEGDHSQDDGGSDAEPRFDAPDEDSEEEGAGLLVALDRGAVGRPITDEAIAAQWFSQDVFAGAPALAAADTRAPAQKPAGGKASTAAPLAAKPKPGKKQPAALVTAAADSDAEAPGTPPPSSTEGAPPPLRKLQKLEASAGKQPPGGKAAPSAAAVVRAAAAKDAAGHGFEVVPRGGHGVAGGNALSSDSDSSSDDEGRVANKAHAPADVDSSDDEDQDFMDSLDAQGKAEVKALAKRMLRKRSRDELLEGAYNKYAFHDAGLPRWFSEDQRRHARAPPVVSREEIDAEKAALRAIDLRPIKKVAEAKARKKKRLATSLDKARAKSEAVVGQEDVPMRSKLKEVEKIYARARAAAGQGGKSDKKKKAGTGRRREQKSSGRPLDRRMMSDKRQTGMKVKKATAKKAKKKGGGRGKNGGGGKGKGGR